MNGAARLADAVLLLHAGVVVFVVGGQALVMAGGVLGWAWVRNLAFRAVHLGLILLVTAQSWLGAVCPLTTWEADLRLAAGQSAAEASFIEHWVSRLLYYRAPWWVFVALYTLFAALVAASWWRWPPRRR